MIVSIIVLEGIVLESLQSAAQYLKQARHVVIFSGAGVSAESGIATFRDALTGLWSRFDPQRLATPEAFEADPELVWGWYEWRRAQAGRVQPNPGHAAIAELERHVPRVTVVTQNVDNLHERAGSSWVIHLHGSIHSPRCFSCARPMPIPLSETPSADGQPIPPPRCPHCNGMARPGVVWFGEALPEEAWQAAWQAVEECDLLLSVGTSAAVYPAAQLPQLAIEQGATVVHVNPEPVTTCSERERALVGPAGKCLPLLLEKAFY